jgi:choline kinase
MTKIDNTVKSTVNINNLTVLILAAGYGRRMGQFSRMINKGLVPYDNKPLISHIIEKFPSNTKFVIACGHFGQQVYDYVASVHDDKDVTFVNIPDYSEGNTGPATTIQHCAEHIQGGFLWLACDTVFEFNYSNRMDHNWIGVYPVDSSISQDYCWVKRDGDDIVEVHNKKHNNSAVDAFIGLMYCKDNSYLENLQRVDAKETYEGFDGLDLKAHTVKRWLDFGTYNKWHELSQELPEISFPKPDELFYSDNGKIIKYFTNQDHVNSRVTRANANPVCMPNNVQAVGHFLIHDFAQGDIVYNQVSVDLFKKMLYWCDNTVWIKPTKEFDTYSACDTFYRKKTLERVNQFRIKYADWSECVKVNDTEVKSIDYYLDLIDWDWLSTTTDWRFIHGDLHFDNTIYDPTTDKFTAIDWRTDFAGQTYGDLYYDLAKMLGGILLSYKAVKNDLLEYSEANDHAMITVPCVDNFDEYEDILKTWVISQSLDWRKVKMLVPIIYLNMSPLHEAPFDKFLIALAQLHFSKIL